MYNNKTCQDTSNNPCISSKQPGRDVRVFLQTTTH